MHDPGTPSLTPPRPQEPSSEAAPQGALSLAASLAVSLASPPGAAPWGPLEHGGSSLANRLKALDRAQLEALLLGQAELARRQETKFHHMMELGSALGTDLHIDELLHKIVEKTSALMDAERSSLFVVDEDSQELWSKVVQGHLNIEIRLQMGQGVAGWVALTGKSLNIRDAYKDPRFNPKVDEDTGYQTRNILCQPIRNQDGDIIGVIQVLNRRQGNFSDEDEYLLSAIASQAAIALEKSKLYMAVVEQNMQLIEIKDKLEGKLDELDMLYELERLVSSAASVEELVERLFGRLLSLVHAACAVLTLRHKRGYQLHGVTDRGEWRVQLERWQRALAHPHALAAEVLRSGTLVQRRLDDDQDPQPLLEAQALLGLELENALIVPLQAEDELLGVLEVYNTINHDDEDALGFTRDDIKLVCAVASQLAASILARQRRQEEQKNERLASIGQMLSGVLHDFKNPMAIISGYVQFMARADDPEKRREFAQNILRQLEQLNQMTRELLSFARGDQTLLLRKVFMHQLMDEVEELLRPELESRGVELLITLEYRNDARVDQVKLKRAILNLARNAAEAMAPQGGGRFAIHVSQDADAKQLVLALSDTGPGIPPEIQDTLFESFVTQGKKDGTGLGLAIVQKIVQEHEGQISFTTQPGQGTTFTIRLPMSPGA